MLKKVLLSSLIPLVFLGCGSSDTSSDGNSTSSSVSSDTSSDGSSTSSSVSSDTSSDGNSTSSSVSSDTSSDGSSTSSSAKGIVDTSFGTDGVVINGSDAVENDNGTGNSITTDSDGKILVAGIRHNGSNQDMAIWRYDSNGSLDTTFGTNGIVIDDNAAGGSFHDYGQSITIDTDGKILVTGMTFNGLNYDMAIWRYDSNGSLDTTFGTNGIVIDDNAAGGGSYDDYGRSITIDTDGKILVAGGSDNTSNRDMAIWRYNGNGSLDTTFGTNGIVIYDSAAGGSGYDHGESITIDTDGKILVAGGSDNTSNRDMAIWRYDSNGSLDTTFGTNGIVIDDNAAGGSFHDYGQSITIDADGKILVAGDSYNGSNSDMAIWRYDSNGSLDTTFGTNGIVIDDNASEGSGYDKGSSMAIDTNGKILVTGRTYNGLNYHMAIWKYK